MRDIPTGLDIHELTSLLLRDGSIEMAALTVNCGICWAAVGQPCRMRFKNGCCGAELKHPHPARIAKTRRRGLLPPN